MRDGLNWYGYCTNNPIMFVDPSGCTITIEGTRFENSISMLALQGLTDDTIDIDKNGNIYIASKAEKITRNNGTFLVRSMIASEHTASIRHINGSLRPDWFDNEPDLYSTAVAIPAGGYGEGSVMTKDGPNIGVDTEIYINPNLYDAGGVDLPLYIQLGHEMIHAQRMMAGTVSPNANDYIPYGGNRYLANYEEILTTGLQPGIPGYQGIGLPGVQPNKWMFKYSMTENGLRAENGLPLRYIY